MFRSRKTLQRADRESGLAFSWRVAMSTTGPTFLAVVLVGLVSLALATGVRVKAGQRPPANESHAVMVMAPKNVGASALERRAVQAGPFPARWNPAADRAYVTLRNRAMREAAESGIHYQPVIEDLEFAALTRKGGSGFSPRVNVLPPVPVLVTDETEEENVKEVGLALRALRSKKEVRVVHASLFLPAVEAMGMTGVRYLLEYDVDGRVQEATRLDSGEHQAALDEWVTRALVSGHEAKPGMLVVESVIER